MIPGTSSAFALIMGQVGGLHSKRLSLSNLTMCIYNIYIYIYTTHPYIYRYKNSSWASSRCGINLIRWSGKVVELRCASCSSIIFASELYSSFKCSWYCVSASLGAISRSSRKHPIIHSWAKQTVGPILFKQKTFQGPSKKWKKTRYGGMA